MSSLPAPRPSPPAAHLFIILLLLVAFTLNFLFQPAPTSAGSDAGTSSSGAPRANIPTGSCAEDPGDLLLNGTMAAGNPNSFGVVAANWNAFVVSANVPNFENAGNEGYDPNGSQYIWSDNGQFDAGIYQRVTNLTAGQTYHFWIVWGQAVHQIQGVNYTTNIDRQIGVDLTGGTNPTAATVQWSVPYNGQSGFNRVEWNLLFNASGSTATFFLRVINYHNDGRNKVFYDTACLYPASGSPTSTPWATPTVTGTPTVGNSPTATGTPTVGLTPGCTTVNGAVFNDANGNGVQDSGDSGAANIKVIAKDPATRARVGVSFSDTNGNYALANLGAGTMKVIVKAGKTYSVTTPKKVAATLPPCQTVNFGIKALPTPTPTRSPTAGTSPTATSTPTAPFGPSATPTATPTGSSGGAPTPSDPSVLWDPRLPGLNVSLQPANVAGGTLYWKLIRADYNDPYQHCGNFGGDHEIYYVVTASFGTPVANQHVQQGWPDGTADAYTDTRGIADIPIWANYWPQNGPGPYSAWTAGLPSDIVAGMGLPGNTHVSFILYFEKRVASSTVTPYPPTVSPTPNCALMNAAARTPTAALRPKHRQSHAPTETPTPIPTE